jgi:hypothetical protein
MMIRLRVVVRRSGRLRSDSVADIQFARFARLAEAAVQ